MPSALNAATRPPRSIFGMSRGLEDTSLPVAESCVRNRSFTSTKSDLLSPENAANSASTVKSFLSVSESHTIAVPPPMERNFLPSAVYDAEYT